MNGDRKGKKDDSGLGSAIDFMLSNAKLVLGVGGAAMLGIATLAVKRVRVCVCVLLSPRLLQVSFPYLTEKGLCTLHIPEFLRYHMFCRSPDPSVPPHDLVLLPLTFDPSVLYVFPHPGQV